MPKASVIIPTHNRPELLKKAVESVLSQTYKDFEIIVIDDGVKEKAKSIVEFFKDERIRYIDHKSEKGGSAARNTGIKAASGEFIAFLDDDDEWLPEKLEIQMREFGGTSDEVGFCFSSVTNVYEDKEVSTSVPSGMADYLSRAISNINGFLTVTLIIKRKVLDDVGLFDESLPSHQDPDLIIRISKKYKGLGINQPLVRVNMMEHEQVGRSIDRRIAGRIIILEKHSDEFKKIPEVLARNYFEMALMRRSQGQFNLAQEYIRKSLVLKFGINRGIHYLSLSFNGLFFRFFSKFLGLWQPAESLGGAVAKASALNFIKRVFINILLFVKTLIIARLLFPNDIGLFALASLFISSIEIFFNPGISSALIQGDKETEKYLNSVWTLNIIRAIFLATLFWFIAPLGGYFFHNQDVIMFIRIMGLYYLIAYGGNVGMLLVQKEMHYHKMFFYDISSAIVQITSTITAAYILKNAWALVIGLFAAKLTEFILSYILHSYRPRLDFNLVGLKQLFKFGKWLSFTGIVTFFVSQGDSIAVGRLLDPSDLAFYQMAFALGTLSALEFVGTLSTIFFPLFSKIKDDIDRTRDAFLRIVSIVFGVIMPATLGLLVLAPEIVRYLYGERWLGMLPILYIVVFYGLLQSFHALFAPFLQGIGKPKVVFFNIVLRAVVMFALIVPLTYRFGASGAALAIVAGLLVSSLVLFFKVKKELNFRVTDFIKNSVAPILASSIMATIILLMKTTTIINGTLPVLMTILLGVFIYITVLFTADTFLGGRFYKSFLWLRANI